MSTSVLKKLLPMKISSCYVSCPLSVPQQTLDKYTQKLRGWITHDKVWWYQRGSAYKEVFFNKVIQDADAFILVLPNNEFKLPIERLTAGCKRELIHALNNNKPTYLAYEAASGFNIYEAVIEMNGSSKETLYNSAIFSGVAGTSGNFEDVVQRTKRIDDAKADAQSSKDFTCVRLFYRDGNSLLYDKQNLISAVLELRRHEDFDYVVFDNNVTMDWADMLTIHEFYRQYKVFESLTFNLINKCLKLIYPGNLYIMSGDGECKLHKLEIGINKGRAYAKYLGECKTVKDLQKMRAEARKEAKAELDAEYFEALAEPTSSIQQQQFGRVKDKEKQEGLVQAYTVAYESMCTSINDVFEAKLLWGKTTPKFKQIMFRRR